MPHSSSVHGGRGDDDDRARPGTVCVRLHISLSRLSRHALWAWCLIIHVVGGGETDILFSSYLGIYCSTECNITVQKQDPNRTNPTIPPFSSVPPPHFCLLPKLHYSTANSSNLLQRSTRSALSQTTLLLGGELFRWVLLHASEMCPKY